MEWHGDEDEREHSREQLNDWADEQADFDNRMEQEMNTIYVLYNVDTYEIVYQGPLNDLLLQVDDHLGITTLDCYNRGLI